MVPPLSYMNAEVELFF